jgi:hypothetical protein
LNSGYANLPIGGLFSAIQENGVPGIAALPRKKIPRKNCNNLGSEREAASVQAPHLDLS